MKSFGKQQPHFSIIKELKMSMDGNLLEDVSLTEESILAAVQNARINK